MPCIRAYRKRLFQPIWLLVLWALLSSQMALAQLNIEITKGRDNATPIAIVPFLWQGNQPLKDDIAQIVGDDLMRSGQFKPFDRNNMLSLPTNASEVVYSDWAKLNVNYLLVGRVTKSAQDARYTTEYTLLNVAQKRTLLDAKVAGNPNQLRAMAHYISDQVYQTLTGVRGDFSTKILYVTSLFHKPGDIDYTLTYADADGHNPVAILHSKKPIMSPTWSPDGKKIAYVSFENKRSAIYIQTLATGARQQLTAFKGLNNAPAWSPDGTKMAMVLSRTGSPEIYIMDLKTRQLTQVTHHFSINTSPAWMPDGGSIVFTSNRSGGPQIFSINLDSEVVTRLTFQGRYNARAKVFHDGKALVMVTKGEGQTDYYISVQNLETGTIKILTPKTRLDDAPSISPNGSMVIYATRPPGKERELAMVSVDGNVQINIPSSQGSVSEPAWSP